MEILKVLENAINAKKSELEKAENAFLEYQSSIENAFQTKVQGILSPVLLEGDRVVKNYDGVTIYRTAIRKNRDGSTYESQQDVLNIYIYIERGITFNTYATGIDNQFEFNRIIQNGKIVEFCLQNKEVLMETYQEYSSKGYNGDEYTTQRTLSQELRELENEFSKAKEAYYMSKLETTGIEFDHEDNWKLPRITMRFDWEVSNVCKIKVVRKTTSGKSVDIEVTSRYKNYDGEVQYSTHNVEKVRFDNIRYAVLGNQEIIVK